MIADAIDTAWGLAGVLMITTGFRIAFKLAKWWSARNGR